MLLFNHASSGSVTLEHLEQPLVPLISQEQQLGLGAISGVPELKQS